MPPNELAQRALKILAGELLHERVKYDLSAIDMVDLIEKEGLMTWIKKPLSDEIE
jgi:hypothetical protein